MEGLYQLPHDWHVCVQFNLTLKLQQKHNLRSAVGVVDMPVQVCVVSVIKDEGGAFRNKALSDLTSD